MSSGLDPMCGGRGEEWNGRPISTIICQCRRLEAFTVIFRHISGQIESLNLMPKAAHIQTAFPVNKTPMNRAKCILYIWVSEILCSTKIYGLRILKLLVYGAICSRSYDGIQINYLPPLMKTINSGFFDVLICDVIILAVSTFLAVFQLEFYNFFLNLLKLNNLIKVTDKNTWKSSKTRRLMLWSTSNSFTILVKHICR